MPELSATTSPGAERPDVDAGIGRRTVLLWGLACVTLLVGLRLWQGGGYWEYSDGVYSLSARQVLDGAVPYEDFAAAQPPTMYYLGAALLRLSDTPEMIRLAMAL